jgi:predicted phosphodiesterase
MKEKIIDTASAMSRRTFFGRAAAAAALAAAPGCSSTSGIGAEAAPKLRVGVLSDVHLLRQKDSIHSDVYFEKALRWYDSMKADAVLLCGDMADCGLVAELEYAAEIWNKVFPDGRRSDGEPVVQLFHFGDHDYGGYAHKYPWAAKCSTDPDAPNHALVNEDVPAIWERLFHEKWGPIQIKTVKGYKFVLAHHPHNMQSGSAIPGLAEALAMANPDPDKPFFYSMHRPVHGTLPEMAPKSLEKDPNHQALRKYPNVLAFFGHCHRNSADELNLWQGEYTVVHVPSTSYCCTRSGRENSFSGGNQPDKKRPQQMQRVDCFSSNQAMFMSVFGDRIVLSRRDVRHDAPMGSDWTIPLPSPDGSCAKEARGKSVPAPAFPPGAEATVSTGKGKNRAKKEVDQVVVAFPPAHSSGDRPRAFDYEVVATAPGFSLSRRVFSTRAYWPESCENEPSCCVFALSELPAGETVTFTVSPTNCYGLKGAPLVVSHKI